MKQIGIALTMIVLFLFLTCTARAETDRSDIASGTVLKPEEIKAEPFRDARIVGTLEKGDRVDITAKDGGWLSINSGKGDGWVRMLSIRRGDATKANYTVEGILSLASGRAGTGNIVATTGIRGLTEETLRLAKFNSEQLEMLELYGVTRGQADKFAAQAGLKARQVEHLSREASK